MSSSDGTAGGLADPWFAPGPKPAAEEPDPAWAAGADGQAGWFLPTGRAGLLPDSISESWDENGAARADRGAAATEAIGAPPWGSDGALGAAGEPPPWENGPWPGPGEVAAQQPQLRRARPGPGEPAGADLEPDRDRRQRSRLMMAGAAAALVLVVVIVVIVTATSGGSVSGCATYPPPVLQAYTRAMTDLSGHAPASAQAADLEHAASMANSSAAAAVQIKARTALFAMASDLDEAYSAITKHRVVTSDLQQRLTADGTALPRACPG